MAGDIPCEVCGRVHDEKIPAPADAVKTEAFTGLRVIQAKQLAALTEFQEYERDLAAVHGTCFLYRTRAACSRHREVFDSRRQALQPAN